MHRPTSLRQTYSVVLSHEWSCENAPGVCVGTGRNISLREMVMQHDRSAYLLRIWAYWFLCTFAVSVPAEVLQPFDLTDYLDRTWSHELVSFPLNTAAADAKPETRRRILSQLAFVAYQLADPDNYSPERRFSANPNMTSIMRSTLAICACCLRNHPMAETWAQAAVAEYKKELTNWIGPNGAWLENPHYQFASIPGLLAGSLALRNAGIHDFLREGQLRKTRRNAKQEKNGFCWNLSVHQNSVV